MTDPALITALAGNAAALLTIAGLWAKTQRAVGSNGGSTLHDGMGEVKRDVKEIRKEQIRQGERIARLEERTGG